MKSARMIGWTAAAAAMLFVSGTSGGTAKAQSNGVGPDPDGDGNPATQTRGFGISGPAAEAELDPPFRIVTFEFPKGEHGEALRAKYKDGFGVTFSKGLTLQACNGERAMRYDSMCTYMRAPSGRFAAVYHDDFRRPLRVRFDRPVCAAALAVIPTGGREGERFTATLQPYAGANDERKLRAAKVDFTWTRDTFRWRNMVGALLSEGAAGKTEQFTRLDISVKSLDRPKDIVDFLIDDVAYIEFIEQPLGSTCETVINDVLKAAGQTTGSPASN